MSNQNEKERVLEHRLIFIVFLNLFAFLVVAVRLYYLQVMEADKYRVMSEENRISTRFLVPPRGVIYDRNGEVLAKNNQDFQALLIAEQTNDIAKTIQTFQHLLPLTVSGLGYLSTVMFYPLITGINAWVAHNFLPQERINE